MIHHRHILSLAQIDRSEYYRGNKEDMILSTDAISFISQREKDFSRKNGLICSIFVEGNRYNGAIICKTEYGEVLVPPGEKLKVKDIKKLFRPLFFRFQDGLRAHHKRAKLRRYRYA